MHADQSYQSLPISCLLAQTCCVCAGVTAFSTGGNEGSLYAALLVNGVQWIATIITVICVDKACLSPLPTVQIIMEAFTS